MQAKLNNYKQDGKLAMKHMWFVVLTFSVIQVAVSIAVAAKNSKAYGGYKSATFAAVWSMFLVLIFLGLGAHVVFVGRVSPVQVGFLVGCAAMLCQLFFVLMCMFFVLGTEATNNGYDTAIADKAYGAFSFFSMIIYFVWAIILHVHKDSVVSSTPPEQSVYEGSSEVRNPMSANTVRVHEEHDTYDDLEDSHVL